MCVFVCTSFVTCALCFFFFFPFHWTRFGFQVLHKYGRHMRQGSRRTSRGDAGEGVGTLSTLAPVQFKPGCRYTTAIYRQRSCVREPLLWFYIFISAIVTHKWKIRLPPCRTLCFFIPCDHWKCLKRGYTNTLKPTQSIYIFLIRINSLVDCAMSACPSDCTSKSLLLQELEISQIKFLYVIHTYIQRHRHTYIGARVS